MASQPPQTAHPLEEEFKERKETSLSSSMLESVMYQEGVLVISFVSGSSIEIPGTEQDYTNLATAGSPGKYMWQHYPEFMNKGRELD